MRLYGSLAGFKYYIKPKPFLGAYVAMENFARGLLRYGTFDEYHTYFDQGFFQSLTRDERRKVYVDGERLKVLHLGSLLRHPDRCYRVLHFERMNPYEEVVFRNLLQKKSIPLTRRAYAVATRAHLGEFLGTCLLGKGGRPYDSIVVPSRPTRDAVLAYLADVAAATSGQFHYRGRVDVIPHGIPWDEFRPTNRAEARRKLGIPPDATVLVSVARFSSDSKMNYDRVIDFFRQLVGRSAADLVLVMAGSDTNRESENVLHHATELGVRDRLMLITDFSDADKAAILSAGDVFLSLSDNLQESFGITLIEAMATGLPLVCSDWNGYKDIVDDGVTGYRIPTVWHVREHPEDVLNGFHRNPYDHTVLHRLSRDVRIDMHAAVERTLELIARTDLRKRMGEKGRIKASRAYSIKTEIGEFEALWQELSEMAECDPSDYTDLHSVLRYEYPKHFQGYASSVIYGAASADAERKLARATGR